MANKKTKKELPVTVCGALSPTGPGAKLAKNGGGKVYQIIGRKKKNTKSKN